MLTADTITDDQIRELRVRQRQQGNRINVDICDTALGELRGVRGQAPLGILQDDGYYDNDHDEVVSFVGDEIRDARGRCAEAINNGQ